MGPDNETPRIGVSGGPGLHALIQGMFQMDLYVSLGLLSTGRNAVFVGIPMLFMYVTTIAANLVTAYNLYATVLMPNLGRSDRVLPVIGSALMVIMSIMLVGAALIIGYDAWGAYRRTRTQPTPEPAAAPA